MGEALARRCLLALALALVSGGLGGCERGSKDPPASADQTSAAATLDAGAIRAATVDGLEAAAADPALAARLGFAAQLEHEEVGAALERVLARAGADPALSAAADAFFVALQDSPAMRAALVDYAEQHPELDLAGLSEGFVGYVDARLTRPELAARLELSVYAQLRGLDPALARAWVGEAGGGAALASGVVARLEDPSVEAAVRERLGRDPAAVQERLSRRLADPARAGELLVALGSTLGEGDGNGGLVTILDHPRTAALLAASASRALADEAVRSRCEALFAVALAPEFDSRAFDQGLAALVSEPAVSREASSLLAAVAREPHVRELVSASAEQFTRQPSFEAALLRALD